MSESLDFAKLVDFSNWKDFESFMIDFESKVDQDVQKSLEYRKKLKEELMKDPNIREAILPRDFEIDRWKRVLEQADQELFGGNVCAVDGTLSTYPMASGTRCRIGIVATSYRNNRIEKVLYVSEREFAEPSANAFDHYNKLVKSHRISSMLVRAIMLYSERKLALDRSEKWKFVHGELLPYELRTGLGAYRALDQCLDLGKRLIEAKYVIAVIEDTTRLTLLNAGDVLERGQYMAVSDLKNELNIYLHGQVDPSTGEQIVSGAHFNPTDKEKFQKFIDSYAHNIRVGLFRVGYKPYLFMAHRDVFDEAAALVMQDGKNQPMRGFPMLIDYADNICKGMLSQGDFQRQIQSRIAKISPDALGFEMVARGTRR